MKILTKILLTIGLVLGLTGFLFLNPLTGEQLTITVVVLFVMGITLAVSAVFYFVDNKRKALRQIIVGFVAIYGAIIVALAGTKGMNQIISIIILVIGITLIISTTLFNIVNIVQQKKNKT